MDILAMIFTSNKHKPCCCKVSITYVPNMEHENELHYKLYSSSTNFPPPQKKYKSMSKPKAPFYCIKQQAPPKQRFQEPKASEQQFTIP